MTPEQFVEALLKLLTDGTALALTGAGVVVLTNIVKFFLKDIPAQWIALVLQVVVWIAYEIAVANSLGGQFEQFWSIFITIATAISSLFIGDVTMKAVYNAGVKTRSAIFGYQRTEPLIEMQGPPLDYRS